MRTVVISEQRLRRVIRDLLREADEKSGSRRVFEELLMLAEKHYINYDPYWLAAAAVALILGNDDAFIDFLLYSIKAGGISGVAKAYNGQDWAMKEVPPDVLKDVSVQIRRRKALVADIRPALEQAFADEASLFMMGSSKLTTVGDSVKKEIEDILQQKSESWLPSGKIARRTFGITFAYDDAIEALTRGDYTKFLGKAVLVRPPKTYEEMSQEEKETFEGVLGGNEADIKLFKHWSKPPEAEIIGVKIEKGAAPIGLAYIYPTVLDGLETLREKNRQTFEWNKKNFSLIDVVSPVVSLAAANFSDIFVKEEDKTKIRPEWRLSSRLDLKEVDSLKSEMSGSDYLEDATRLSTTGFAIIDLRATLPPNKVYTQSGLNAAAKFECVADSTLEKIELAFADMNPDINMACKLAMADSLKIGLSVAGAQIIQSFLPAILGAVGLAVGGPPGAAIGGLSGRVINAVLTVVENGITQLVPLGYGVMYFARKGELETAAWCLARLIVSIIQTILQVVTPEIAAILPSGKIKDILLKGVSRELFINIGGVFVDFIASLEQADALNPGQKAEILSALSKIIPVWDKEMTPEEFQKLETSVAVNTVKDLQQINSLFDAFNALRYSSSEK